MNIVLLRFDAPLMSFGAVVVDNYNTTDPFAYRAMLTGLIGNALGFRRTERQALFQLQSRLRYAARRDRNGEVIVDYQTVDLGADGPMNQELAWTYAGVLEQRGSGKATSGTHIRFRHYLADSVQTVAITLEPADEVPTLQQVSDAIREPARPLFIGRKCCIPSGPVWLGQIQAQSLREALETVPRIGAAVKDGAVRCDTGRLNAIWPTSDGQDPQTTQLWPRVEDRDAVHDIHVGRRLYVRGTVDPPMDAPGNVTEEMRDDGLAISSGSSKEEA